MVNEQIVQNMVDDAHTWFVNRAKQMQKELWGTYPEYRYVLDFCLREGTEKMNYEQIRRVVEAREKAAKAIRMIVGDYRWNHNSIELRVPK